MTPEKTALLALTAVSLFACTQPGPRAITSGWHTIYVHPRSLLPQGGDDAQISGRLAIRQGCVVLESESGEEWYPVVWPGGTRIASTDPFAVRLPSGEEVVLGEPLLGGGGYHSAATLPLEIPAECLNEWQEVAVFNADDKPLKG